MVARAGAVCAGAPRADSITSVLKRLETAGVYQLKRKTCLILILAERYIPGRTIVHNKPKPLQLWSLIQLQKLSMSPVQQAYTYTLRGLLEAG